MKMSVILNISEKMSVPFLFLKVILDRLATLYFSKIVLAG